MNIIKRLNRTLFRVWEYDCDWCHDTVETEVATNGTQYESPMPELRKQDADEEGDHYSERRRGHMALVHQL